MTTVKMNYLHTPWMYRTWMRKYSQALQKTTQSRPLPSYSSSIGWRAGSRRTTSHLLKTNVIPAPGTQALSWTHQFLRRYFWEQFSVLPINDIIDFKLKGWHVYNNNNTSVLMWKHCIRNYELHSVATARNKNKSSAFSLFEPLFSVSDHFIWTLSAVLITSITWSRFPKLWSISVLVFKPQQGSQDTIGEDGFFDLLSRFQGNRLDDQRCSLLDSPSHLPTHSSPSSTPPVAERKCELAPLCSHLCSHHIQVFWWIIQCGNTDICTKCRSFLLELHGVNAVCSDLSCTSCVTSTDTSFKRFVVSYFT